MRFTLLLVKGGVRTWLEECPNSQNPYTPIPGCVGVQGCANSQNCATPRAGCGQVQSPRIGSTCVDLGHGKAQKSRHTPPYSHGLNFAAPVAPLAHILTHVLTHTLL